MAQPRILETQVTPPPRASLPALNIEPRAFEPCISQTYFLLFNYPIATYDSRLMANGTGISLTGMKECMPINWKVWVSTNPRLKLPEAAFQLHATEPLQVSDRSTMNYSYKVFMQNFSYKSLTVKLFAGYYLAVIDLPHII